ncbi:MAG: hypothetical protein P4L54_07835 [Acidocella sp.]|nr:hypothetical protein [Acidocella sp.]
MAFFKTLKAKLTGQPAAPADDLPLAFARLMAALEQQDFEALLTAAQALLQRHDLPPNSSANVLRLQARAKMETGDFAGAVADYKTLLSGGLDAVSAGLHAETLAFYGFSLFKCGAADEAKALLEQATALAADDADVKTFLAGIPIN